jgi:hypothetical protein
MSTTKKETKQDPKLLKVMEQRDKLLEAVQANETKITELEEAIADQNEAINAVANPLVDFFVRKDPWALTNKPTYLFEAIMYENYRHITELNLYAVRVNSTPIPVDNLIEVDEKFESYNGYVRAAKKAQEESEETLHGLQAEFVVG